MDGHLVSSKMLFCKEDRGYQHFESLAVEFRFDKEDFVSGFPNARYKEKKSSETLVQVLSRLSLEILNKPRSKTLPHSYMKRLEQVECSYKCVMQKFLYRMKKFLCTVQELGQMLKKTVIEFHNVSRMIAKITLLYGGTDITFLLAHFMHKLFKFRWNPSIPSMSILVGAVSLTSSFFALVYMKYSTLEISDDVRNVNTMLFNMIFFLDEDTRIDRDVLHLFPHGIDSKLIMYGDLEERIIFKDKIAWKQFLCFVILMTNVEKDEKLLHNEIFLEKVKLFVESKSARIWYYRIKLKKLLDNLFKKVCRFWFIEFMADHKVHIERTDFYVKMNFVPCMFSWFDSTNWRIVWTTVGATLAFKHLDSNHGVEFRGLQKVYQIFEKDFREITKVYEALENNYD